MQEQMPRNEEPEAAESESLEERAGRAVGGATSTVEQRDAAGADASTTRMQRIGEFFKRKGRESISPRENWKSIKKTGGFALDTTRVGLVTVAKMVWNLVLFAKDAIEGKATFKGGYELGKNPFEDKKSKGQKLLT